VSDAFLGVTSSVRKLIWRARCRDEKEVQALEQQAGLDYLTAQLLAGRGITPDQASSFLKPSLREHMPDPALMAGMETAVSVIADAVENQKNIAIFADYDVDGGTSAAQLIRWGRYMGCEFDLYIPDRVAEGYGPSADAFHKLKAKGAQLVITVDCGAAAHEALEAARDIDLPIIVIDHHLMHGEMPYAEAIVNPNRPDDISGLGDLAAAGVTFMLLAALNREMKRRGRGNVPNLLDLLGLAAFGTICDVVKLQGLNRVIVKQGLQVLSSQKHIGIAALADIANISPPFGTYHAGFVLGPRINAGGRIGRADMGAELLSTENAQLAYAYAAELDRVNATRRQMQDDMLREAIDTAELHFDKPIIIIDKKGWHPGIIGIIAGRLKDQFDKPAIVISFDGSGAGKGSARSLRGVNIGEFIAQARDAGVLISGGGHAMAGGLSINRDTLDKFKHYAYEQLQEDVEIARAQLGLDIDALITASAATMDLIQIQDTIGPFGAGNPQPVFGLANMRIAYAKRLNGGHIRCSFEDSGGARLSGICFRADESGLSDTLLSVEDIRVHIAGRIKLDRYQGREKIDFHLVDIAMAS